MTTLYVLIGLLVAELLVILFTTYLMLSDTRSQTSLARVLGWTLRKQFVIFGATWLIFIVKAVLVASAEGLP